MNIRNCLRSCRQMAALLALLPLASRAVETTEAAKDPASEPLTHVLFTGADIRILYDGKLHPVRDVEGNSFVIRFADQGKAADVPLTAKARKVVLSRVQTLTERTATVANFKYERAFTPGNDPHRKVVEGMQSASRLIGYASDLRNQADRTPATVIKPVLEGREVKRVEVVNPDYLPAQQRAASLESISGGVIGSPGHQAGKVSGEEYELFDALEMEFELTSPTPIKAAYMVAVAEYHTKDRPKDSETWTVAKSLGAIGSTPRKVWLSEGGLPPGYILDKVHVHLYEDGVEIATDLSENRASLTRDEAHEYLVIDHTSTHKAATMPAQLVLKKVPEDWATRPRDESFLKTYFVKVDKTGRPVGAFEDAACTTTISNSYCDTVLRDQLFLPALENGNPVDSIVRIKLSKLAT